MRFVINRTIHWVPVKFGQSQESLFKYSTDPRRSHSSSCWPPSTGRSESSFRPPAAALERIGIQCACSRTLQQWEIHQAQSMEPELSVDGHLTNHDTILLPKSNPKRNHTAKSWDFKVNLVYFSMTDDWLYTFRSDVVKKSDFPSRLKRNIWLFMLLLCQVGTSQSENSKNTWKED